MMAVRGDVQVNNPIPTRQGCILISTTLVMLHDKVDMIMWPMDNDEVVVAMVTK